VWYAKVTEAHIPWERREGTESGVWLGLCPCHARWVRCPFGTGETPVLSDSCIFYLWSLSLEALHRARTVCTTVRGGKRLPSILVPSEWVG